MVALVGQNHKMHHRTSTESDRLDSMGRCAMYAAVTLDQKIRRIITVDSLHSISFDQACATPPHLLENLPHWVEHLDKCFNLLRWFTFWSKCSHQWGDCPTNGEEWHTPAFDAHLRIHLYASQTKIVENGTACRACANAYRTSRP